MRFIPTTAAKVEALRKQAKRMHRAGRGKHTELLDRVARGAGYEHWHHVQLCFKESAGVHQARDLISEIDAIIQSALAGKGKAVCTGPEASSSQPFILFSTDDGDAWMLDAEEDQVICLAWKGVRQAFTVRDLPSQIEIEWDGTFELSGPFFSVATGVPDVGTRFIGGYPVDRLRAMLEDVRGADKRIDGIFGRTDAVPLSPDIVEQLVRTGWDPAAIERARRQGAVYSPSRDSLLFPAMGNM